VGLLGGSFNPAHAGHRHIACVARRRLRLDQVWLLVSPGNPLKPAAGMAPFTDRLASACVIADGRRIVATSLEARLHSHFTFRTLHELRRRFPRIQFVWLTGADNLIELPRWQRWLDIVATVSIAVLPRPSYTYRAFASLAACRLRRARRSADLAPMFACLSPPAWIFLPASEIVASATAIRAAHSGVSDHHQKAAATGTT
jgi:nicotinate-nucleotide adenylyltransferase